MNEQNSSERSFNREGGKIDVAILPHHSITSSALDDWYKHYFDINGSYDRIVILSPDHFANLRGQFILGVSRSGSICFEGTCQDVIPLKFTPNNTSVRIPLFSSLQDESINEHGVGVHIPYIHKYNPDALISPLIVQRELSGFQKSKDLSNQLFSELRNYSQQGEKILLIGSVDFSHHVDERFAQAHDITSIESFKSGNFENVEVDCRNCLLIVDNVAKLAGKPYFIKDQRTSVASLGISQKPFDNTSHIFGHFGNISEGQNQNKVTAIYFGDTHFARGYEYYLAREKNYLQQWLDPFAQMGKSSEFPFDKYYHRPLSGYDIVSVNFESSLAKESDCPKTSKSIVLATDPIRLVLFQKIGVNMVQTANNHFYDCGSALAEKSGKIFSEYGMESAGMNRSGDLSIIKKEIHGLKLAFVSLNDVDMKIDTSKVEQEFEKLKKDGYLITVNIHWGDEYAKEKHTPRQESLAKFLIDHGANLIIGHHPHVVQDVGEYKGVKIYYSVGNFLFDQPFPETLEGYGISTVYSSGGITSEIIPFERDKRIYTLKWK
ncbi:AmmeMemoRadiSam system protein B [Candidatus Gracilibacteria bacterium]|nr:AmmeMemoRadiSam system protein B [Candidatus Gracilibacteria bacterium]